MYLDYARVSIRGNDDLNHTNENNLTDAKTGWPDYIQSIQKEDAGPDGILFPLPIIPDRS